MQRKRKTYRFIIPIFNERRGKKPRFQLTLHNKRTNPKLLKFDYLYSIRVKIKKEHKHLKLHIKREREKKKTTKDKPFSLRI